MRRSLGQVAKWTVCVLLAWPLAARAAAPPQAIELDEIRVQGNTVLSPRDIEQAVYPYLGPGKTATDVEHARQALAQLYQQHGYQTVAVTIPAQRVTNGLVFLKVIEQPVERLRVVGAHYFEPALIRRQAPSLKPGTVPNMTALRADTTRLNQFADRTVTPSFRPGRAANTVDVDLNVQDALPLHGSLELNNRRSPDTSALRLSGSLSYGNFFQRGDTGTLFFQVAPTNTADTRVVGGSYLFHIPGTIMAVLASYINSDSSVNTLGSTNVVGKGQIASIRLQVPLGLEDGFIQTLSAGLDYKKLDENVSLGGSTSHAPVTYYPVSATYAADWVEPQSQTSLNATATFALRPLISDRLQLDNRRFSAARNFAYLRASLSRLQTLPLGFQLYASGLAQITSDTLISSEQLSLGGLDTVRGYLESEALGDKGFSLQVEARSPSIAAHFGKFVNDWRFHVFGDIGNVSIYQPGQDLASSYTLASAGLGTRVQLFGTLNASLEDAFLLARGPISKSGDNRVLFRLYGSF